MERTRSTPNSSYRFLFTFYTSLLFILILYYWLLNSIKQTKKVRYINIFQLSLDCRKPTKIKFHICSEYGWDLLYHTHNKAYGLTWNMDEGMNEKVWHRWTGGESGTLPSLYLPKWASFSLTQWNGFDWSEWVEQFPNTWFAKWCSSVSSTEQRRKIK